MEQKIKNSKSAGINTKLPFYEIFKGMSRQSRSMRSKLMLYLCCLVLAGSGILLLTFAVVGSFSESEIRLEQNLQVQLQNRKRDIKERLDLFTSNGIDLSKRLTILLEREILSYPYDIRELENNEEGLREMQEDIYMLLESKLHVTRASGVFAIFDTTVNTAAPTAKNSRSGVYLRMANVSGNVLEDDIFLFRGNPNVAIQNKIQIHNRWNMEFDIDKIDWYYDQLFGDEKKAISERYLWISKHHLEGTWEDSVFLSIPIIGSEGAHYGICGLEISSLLFRLSYPKFESRYGDIVTVIAPTDRNRLLVSDGLSGAQGNSYVNENEDLFISAGKRYNIYSNSSGKYIGVHKPIEGAVDNQGRQWEVAVFVSYASFEVKARHERLILIFILLIFIIAMLLISFIISRKFVKPIEQGIESLKTDELYKNHTSSGITEIDVLAEFLKSKEERYMSIESNGAALPANVEELFNQFIKRSKELTASERNILGYYAQGYEISEVPDILCISLNTVRKHNRSIYKKLEVNSKDELQMYLNLLMRCGRLEEVL